MNIRKFYPIILLIAYCLLNANTVFAEQPHDSVTANAIWNPNIEIMKQISDDCGSVEMNFTGKCLISIMENSGASPQAIYFTQKMGTEVYMNGFKELGKIDAAFIYYPLRVSDREGCLLVNGNPPFIDLGDLGLLPIQKMEQNTDYIELEKKYPHLSIFSGDLRGTVYPYLQNMPHKITRIVSNFELRNGCSSCQLVGFAEFGFDFDSTENYMGSVLLNIKIAANENKTVFFNQNPSNYFSNPSNPINVTAGDKFTISLISNHSEGYKWQLADKIDTVLISLEGKDFTRPYETLPNAPGKELWFFAAKKKGAAKIDLKYIPSWDDGTKSYKTYSFNVFIN